jgi:hypothetical protein
VGGNNNNKCGKAMGLVGQNKPVVKGMGKQPNEQPNKNRGQNRTTRTRTINKTRTTPTKPVNEQSTINWGMNNVNVTGKSTTRTT